MSGAPKLDGRRARALEAEMVRRAEAVLGRDGQDGPVGPVARAILRVAARIGEEVVRRLDQAPAKQADNFYTAAGIGRDPARPATVAVAFKLVESAAEVVSAPPQLQLMADAGGPVLFETEKRIDLVPGTIAALRGIDATADSITIPSGSVTAPVLPSAVPLKRRLRSGAAAGATKLQIDPAAGLAPGMLLQIGEGDSTRHYRAVAVEEDLVTVEPSLETGLSAESPVLEVDAFAPFDSVSRNHQSHFLYLGHASLLDVPSAVTITISGAGLPDGTVWSWWGIVGESNPPDWHPLTPVPNSGGAQFAKEEGKPVKTKVTERESLWLRAEWPGKSTSSVTALDLRLAIGGSRMCGAARSDICGNRYRGDLNVDFEAVGNGTPLVTNMPFHPFGLEPRLFDSFYVGSNEAFSKIGAQVAMCFRFAGATLGPLAIVKDVDANRAYGVGADGLLYRLQLTPAPAGAAGHTSTDLRAVPLPAGGKSPVLLQSQSPLACWRSGPSTMVAVAGEGSIEVAELPAGPDVTKVKWLRLPLPSKDEIVSIAVHSGSNGVSLYALQTNPDPPPAGHLFCWDGVAAGAPPTSDDPDVLELIEVDGGDAVLTLQDTGTELQLWLRKAGVIRKSTAVFRSDLPEVGLRAIADPAPANSGIYFLLGYDEVAPGQYQPQLVKLDASGSGLSVDPKESIAIVPPLAEPLPLALSPGRPVGSPAETRPTISIATQNPIHISWYYDGANIRPAVGRDRVSLGASINPKRHFAYSQDYVVVQRPDRGLFFRPRLAGGALVQQLHLPAAPGLLVEASHLGASAAVYAHFDHSATAPEKGVILSGAGAVAGGTHILLKPVSASFVPAPATGDDLVAYSLHTLSDFVDNGASGTIRFPGTTGLTDVVMRIDFGGPRSVWTFHRTSTADSDWPIPTGFPAPLSTSWTWRRLIEIGRATQWDEVALLANATPIFSLAAELEAVAAEDGEGKPLTVHKFGTGAAAAIVYPHSQIRANEALFLVGARRWEAVGPDQAGNPSLSWEYWNGQSWWALPTHGSGALDDRTESFTQDGGVFFNVPADIQPSQVNGREGFWVRTRLVRGDYGEARVTVVNRPGVEAGTTEQVVTHDSSSVRAPQITSLKLGYCALDLVRPEIVLTADSLGFIDQTSANEAGLEIPVFTPVAELMNPVDAAEEAAEAGRCEMPCPRPPAPPGPDCSAPGAYESCDSPCVASPGDVSTPAGEATGFVRGLMLGFARGFAGNAVSLHVDAEPAGAESELAVEMLRDGRFVPIRVAEDTSYGLTEPGIVTLDIPARPDRGKLFGIDAHWLRLRPKRNPTSWSPRLRAIHLNAVLARSVETRTMERLGTSTGLEGQSFRVSEAPVDPGSLVLRVRETLAEEDDPNRELDVRTYPSGLPGTWVRWAVSEDLIEADEPERAFLLDSEQGIIRFGDGKAGRIPPLGGDILVETFARVIGQRANAVPPGAQLRLLTPLAGVERATAVDYAAGASDAEAPEAARRRAPAKVRNGRRILTRADLEDHAMTLSPAIAQVRADDRRGAIRLVVAMKGAQPKPSPAAARGFAAAIREVAGYGLARPGGLVVVGPRLLPIAIDLVLEPRSPALFAEAAKQARDLLVALFDPATGNLDGGGWPLGRLPVEEDIAAALAPIEELALPVRATLERADRDAAAERRLPDSIPSDVLVRLDPSAVRFERSREAAA